MGINASMFCPPNPSFSGWCQMDVDQARDCFSWYQRNQGQFTLGQEDFEKMLGDADKAKLAFDAYKKGHAATEGHGVNAATVLLGICMYVKAEDPLPQVGAFVPCTTARRLADRLLGAADQAAVRDP